MADAGLQNAGLVVLAFLPVWLSAAAKASRDIENTRDEVVTFFLWMVVAAHVFLVAYIW